MIIEPLTKLHAMPTREIMCTYPNLLVPNMLTLIASHGIHPDRTANPRNILGVWLPYQMLIIKASRIPTEMRSVERMVFIVSSVRPESQVMHLLNDRCVRYRKTKYPTLRTSTTSWPPSPKQLMRTYPPWFPLLLANLHQPSWVYFTVARTLRHISGELSSHSRIMSAWASFMSNPMTDSESITFPDSFSKVASLSRTSVVSPSGDEEGSPSELEPPPQSLEGDGRTGKSSACKAARRLGVGPAKRSAKRFWRSAAIWVFRPDILTTCMSNREMSFHVDPLWRDDQFLSKS